MTKVAKIVLVLGAILVVALVAAALGLSTMAKSRGVETVSPPAGSMIELTAKDADYADAYRVEVSPLDFPTIEVIDAVAFQKGELAGRGPSEIVYRGRAPGVAYHISYLLDADEGRHYLTVSTAVHYESTFGALYFAAVKPGHRRLVPFVLSRWAKE